MKKRRKIGALALGFTMAASCCFGNGVISNLGGMLSTVEASTSSIVYNPSTGENGGFTVKANKWSKASSNTVVYNGMVLDVADKVESSTKINFTSDSKGTLVLVFNEGSAGKSILVDGESYEIPSSGVVTASVGAGDHEVLKDSGSSYLYYMEFTRKGGSVETTEATTEETTEATTKAPVTEATTEATTKADTNSSSVSWNMGNSSFKNLGTISGDVTVNGLTIKATSAKTVNVISDEATVESNTFGYSLALGGSGSLKYRAVAFDTNGQAVVKVISRSSGSSTRTLMVVGDYGTELGTISAKPDADIASVNINYSGKVYIYSKGSGINIYKVQVDNKSSVEETTKKNTTEATTKKETTTEATTSNAAFAVNPPKADGADVTFKDVPATHWANDAVSTLAKAGVVNGLSADTFGTATNSKRGDFVVMLVRALGIDSTSTANFSDVDSSKYYAKAIATAKAYGIVNGYNDNTFKPENYITRQDMMVMVANALNAMGVELDTDVACLDNFSDTVGIANYARTSVAALVNAGIVKGSDNKIEPVKNITRAEMAQLVKGVYDKALTIAE